MDHCDATNGLANKFRLVRRMRDADLIFVQRRLLPRWLIRSSKTPLVFDFDDAIFCHSDGQRSSSREKKFAAMTERASLLFAGNGYLAGYGGERAMVIPTLVDAGRYQVSSQPSGTLSLIWIGSRSTSKYLDFFRPVLASMIREGLDFTLNVVADFDFYQDGVRVNNITWTSENEVRALSRAHIGIAPMLENNWTLGKCAFKVLQYMAAGLPVISSPVGANKDVIVSNETGLLAESADEWITAVRELQDPERRLLMGKNGRERVLSHYSEPVIVDAMVSALSDRGLIS